MKETKQLKERVTPQFQLIRMDESNKVFFTASEDPTPSPAAPGATLGSISGW